MNPTAPEPFTQSVQTIKVGTGTAQVSRQAAPIPKLGAVSPTLDEGENIVQRLRRRINDAKSLGCEVRLEWLEDSQGDWCIVSGKRTIFLDSGQTAAEQLVQLEEILHQIFPALLPRS